MFYDDEVTISHLLKQNSAVPFFQLPGSIFSNTLLISSAPFSLLRVFLAFWALKLVRLSLLVKQRHKIQLEKSHYLPVQRSIKTQQKCWYETLLVHNFFLNLLHYIDSYSNLGLFFFSFATNLSIVNRVEQKRT